MKCAWCENPLSYDERSRASTLLPGALCDACVREWRANKLAAESLMHEARTSSPFRNALLTLWKAARVHGAITLSFSHGELCGIEFENKPAGLNQPRNEGEKRKCLSLNR
jgi:hypothetical protein